MNTRHPNIHFTKEVEIDGSLSFLYVKISRVNNSFATNLYCKPTFSGVFVQL